MDDFKLDLSKYRPANGKLSLKDWELELDARWELLEYGLEKYGNDKTWELIKTHGYLTNVYYQNKNEKPSPERTKNNDYGGFPQPIKTGKRSIGFIESPA